MINKIIIPGTSIALEIAGRHIAVSNAINYDIQMEFKNANADTSLDTEGDVFEPLYWLDVKAIPKKPTEYHSSLGAKAEKRNLTELQKFFEFVEDNKRNLFKPLSTCTNSATRSRKRSGIRLRLERQNTTLLKMELGKYFFL